MCSTTSGAVIDRPFIANAYSAARFDRTVDKRQAWMLALRILAWSTSLCVMVAAVVLVSGLCWVMSSLVLATRLSWSFLCNHHVHKEKMPKTKLHSVLSRLLVSACYDGGERAYDKSPYAAPVA
jgi:hypothetical protein